MPFADFARPMTRAARPRRSRIFRPGAGLHGSTGPETLEARVVLSALPEGFIHYQVADGLSNPTGVDVAPDGRVFITEQDGAIRILKDGALLPEPFINLPAQNLGERGLHSLVFDPDFVHNGYVYVYYTDPSPVPHNRLVRLTAHDDHAHGYNAVVLFETDPSTHTLHNGGGLAFGPDGKIYLGVGDGYTRTENAQSLDNLFGKVLRLNPDGSIPEDNPFYHVTEGKNRAIFATGLRNPFRLDIQADTGRLLINDVGASGWEEINLGRPGGNYGWPYYEGPGGDPNFDDPLHAYPHNGIGRHGCAITGGLFYQPEFATFPDEYLGQYFFIDFCEGRLQALNPETGEVTLLGDKLAQWVVDLSVDLDGSMYYLVRGVGASTTGDASGSLHKIEYPQGQQKPRVLTHPASPGLLPAGYPAVFSVLALGESPLAFQWQHDGVDIPGAVGTTFAIPQASVYHSGQYRVIVSNEHGAAISRDARLAVVDDQPPLARIQAPRTRGLHIARPGQLVRLPGVGLDERDGRLQPSAFTWRVDMHHNDHTHPFLPLSRGTRNITFTIPRDIHEDGNVWYRVYLTVTDSSGLTSTTTHDVYPSNSPLVAQPGRPAPGRRFRF